MDNPVNIINNIILPPLRLIRMTAVEGPCFHCGVITHESCSEQTLSNWFHKQCYVIHGRNILNNQYNDDLEEDE